MKNIVLAISTLLLGIVIETPAPQVVQFNIGKILNARPVTTVAGGKLITWTKGIDGNGVGDGYLTQSAAIINGDKDAHALPDKALIPASANHPEIQLHYTNTDSVNMQAYAFNGEDKVDIPISAGNYTAVYFALTSAEGVSDITVKLTYTSDVVTKDFVIPDYWADIKPGDESFCYLLHDLAKWGTKNNMTEKDHHNIDLLKIPTNPNWKLKSISISKSKPGYLMLWAAAGVRAN